MSPIVWALAAFMLLLFVRAFVTDETPTGGSKVDPGTIAQGQRLEQLREEYQAISFADLSSFHYGARMPNGLPAIVSSKREAIPPRILALNGKKVAVDGFMLPLDFDGGGVSQFILNASYDMCAFGAPSALNERIDVTVADSRRTIYTHLPLTVFGIFDVGEQTRDGRVVSLYRLRALAIGQPRR
jgi:hypothetical protein